MPAIVLAEGLDSSKIFVLEEFDVEFDTFSMDCFLSLGEDEEEDDDVYLDEDDLDVC